MANKVIVRNGNKQITYPSIKAASDATGIPYITLWMRINKLKWPVSTSAKADVRQYNKREMAEA